jgi:hypothetical protein
MNPVSRTTPLAALLLLCAAPSGAPRAQGPAAVAEAWQAPDGSRFVLAPLPGEARAPVVHWVIAVPASLDEDPIGALGLSRAVIRASLNGTWTQGSRDATAEARAIEDYDALVSEAWPLLGRTAPWPDGLAARLGAAHDRTVELGDPQRWRRAIADAPATGPEVREVQGATLIHLAARTAAVPRIASLVHDWRENAVLRGYHDAWREVAAELRALADSPSGRLRREVLGTTYLGAAAARTIADRAAFVPYVDARRHLTGLVHPQRSLHVLSGRFDPAEMKAALAAIFDTTALPTPPRPVPLQPAEARGRRSVLRAAGHERGIALAFALPADASPAEVDALVALLAGWPFAHLPRWKHRVPGARLAVDAPFPATARPGHLLIEAVIEGAAGPDVAQLEQALLQRLAGLPGEFRDEAAAQAIALATGRRTVDRESAEGLAFLLAVGCGILGRSPAEAAGSEADLDSARLRGLVDRIFGSGPGTVVVLDPAR